MRMRPLREDEPLPLLIEPAVPANRSLAALTDWVTAEPKGLEEKLTLHGALLLRGFAVEGAPDFERVARAFDPGLKNDYLGTSPRDALTSHVFSASELPGYYPIPQHIEMSFTKTPPRRIFFSCLLPPRGIGGETPLCDFRRVYRVLDPAVRRRFEERGVRNIRNYDGPEGGSRLDPWKLKRWDEMFRTTDRAAVEATCREQGFDFLWRPGGRLRLTNTQQAVKAHPVTGEPVWFNHSQVFHLSSAAGEYRRIAAIAARRGLWRDRLLSRFTDAVSLLKARAPAEDQAMNCSYGDGSPIPTADMEKVRDAIWQCLVVFPWQRGDVTVIDNQAVSHGRLPYRGPRQIVVAWS